MKGLTDIPGILVGHASDYKGLTGCTAILCPAGAVGGVALLGSATGTQEIDLLNPAHVTERIHGIVLAGGSAFGLEAAAGVRRFLEKKGIGFETRAARVPLVPSAILYDLAIGRADAHPSREMGEAAAAYAKEEPVAEGAVGAGTGATVGKLFGMSRAMKSGIGTYTVTLGASYREVKVAAMVAVNAFGDVRNPRTGEILAGARQGPDSRLFSDTAQAMLAGALYSFRKEATTLAVVATNARLNKVETNQLAKLAGIGMARTLSPAFTQFDGDTVFALSLGEQQADLNALGVAAEAALAEAILRAVRLAPSLGGVPGLHSGAP